MPSSPSSSVPKKLTDHPHLNLYSTEVQTRNGPSTWIFASRKSQPGGQILQADAVVIIAVVTDGAEPRLVITREHRVPLGGIEISVPSGLIDPGETASEAAARELREETGLELVRIHHLSPPAASSAGMTDETVSLVYVEATGVVSTGHQTEEEEIDVHLMTLSEIRELLRAPHPEVISSRLYPILLGYLAANAIALPPTI